MWLIPVAVFGLVAGVIARMLHPGDDRLSWLWAILLGVAGAVIGGCVGRPLGFDTRTGLGGWVTVVVGSFVPLLLYHLASFRTPAPVGSGPTTFEDYKASVLNDLSSHPNA
jgi:uncharacterized membrane protein YeaQ/YmgE (transglycosylase-associated protein family)